MKLYELSEAYSGVLNLIDEDSPDADITKALTTIEGELQVKATSIANLIKSLEAEVVVIKKEEVRLSLRRKSRENAAESVKQYLKGAMEQMGLSKIKGATRTISLGGSAPALKITNADLIPQKFLTHVPAHDDVRNDEVKKALKAGEEVPGAKLVSGISLRIR